jgi:tetratricopeptide (TPR) repeat protein
MNNRFLASLLVVLCFTVACNTDPNVAKKKYVDRGNRYFEKAKYKEALIMYRNALRKDLRYGEAYYRSALTEIKLSRYSDAARDLQRAVELQPDNLDAYTRLINIYLNAYLGDATRPKALVAELQGLRDKLAKKHPESYEYQRISGYIALMESKPKDAINFFEKANSIKPLQSDLMLIYIQTLAGDGRAAEAEKLGYDTLKKDPHVGSIYDALFLEYLRQHRIADAERILKSKIDNNPNVADNYLQLAAHYYSQKQRPEMLATLERLSSNTKDFPNGALQVGDFFLRIKDLDLAMQQYKNGLKLDEKQKHVFQKRMIETLILQDKKQEATDILGEILKEDPKDDEALAIRAALLMLTGSRDQLQSAINDLQTVVSRLPDNPVVRFNLGRAHLAKGNTQQAKIQFEEALKLRPDYMLPRVALAQILQQSGDYAKVVQMCGEILTYDATNIQARLLRTRALIGLRESKQARAELITFSTQNPQVWEAKLQLAALDLAEKNYKSAEDVFRKMYSETRDQRALMGLTESFTQQGQYEQAMKLMKDELAKTPERTDYLVAIGNIAIRAQKYNDALESYKKALEKYPRAADIWIRLGETQRVMGDPTNALTSFAKAKDLAPNNLIPYVKMALMAEAVGDKEKARPLYEQILKIKPDNALALNNLAYLLADNGTDLDQALTMAQRAKQAYPQDSNIADTLGWIYIKKNLSDSAISIFKDLVRQEPDRSTFHYHLAMALAQKGDKASARKELEAALKKQPVKDEELKIRELLQKVS